MICPGCGAEMEWVDEVGLDQVWQCPECGGQAFTDERVGTGGRFNGNGLTANRKGILSAR